MLFYYRAGDQSSVERIDSEESNGLVGNSSRLDGQAGCVVDHIIVAFDCVVAGQGEWET